MISYGMPCTARWEGLVGFRSWAGFLDGFENHLKLSVVNLNCDDVKTSTQWRLIGSLAEHVCKVKSFPQQSKQVLLAMQLKIFNTS